MGRVVVLRNEELWGFWRLFGTGICVVVCPSLLAQKSLGLGLALLFFLALVFVFTAVVEKRVRSTRSIAAWWIATTFCFASAPMLLEYLSGTKFYGNIFTVHLMFFMASGVAVLLGSGASRVARYLSGSRVIVQTGTLCPNCAYDLRGNESMVCPECGRGFSFEELGVTAAEFAAMNSGE